jgi:hypothetical protein
VWSNVSTNEFCDLLDEDPYDHHVASRSPTGEWSSPTREIGGSQLSRLVHEARAGEAAAVEMIHDEPTRKCPSAALELIARARRDSNNNLALPLPPPPEAPRKRPPPEKFASETEIDDVMAALADSVVVPIHEMPAVVEPAAIPVQAPVAKPQRKRSIGTRLALSIALLGGIGAGVYWTIGL